MIKEAIDRLLQLGASPTPNKVQPDGDPYVIIPQGTVVNSLAHLVPPARIKQAPQFMECSSFIDYVNRFKTEVSQIFVNISDEDADCVCGASFTALLDYHSAAPALKPGYCQHQARFNTVQTPEWMSWMGADRRPTDQVTFATFLEENAKLFVEPKGAELLELVRSLNGHKNARFNQTVRLDTGACSVAYEEDIQIRGTGGTKAETLELPATIKAGIAPFQGSPLYQVTARLRVRIEERKLRLWYETIQPHVVIRDSVLLLAKQVADKTGIIPLLGKP